MRPAPSSAHTARRARRRHSERRRKRSSRLLARPHAAAEAPFRSGAIFVAAAGPEVTPAAHFRWAAIFVEEAGCVMGSGARVHQASRRASGRTDSVPASEEKLCGPGSSRHTPPGRRSQPGALLGREGAQHQPRSPRSLWRWGPWTVGARWPCRHAWTHWAHAVLLCCPHLARAHGRDGVVTAGALSSPAFMRVKLRPTCARSLLGLCLFSATAPGAAAHVFRAKGSDQARGPKEMFVGSAM